MKQSQTIDYTQLLNDVMERHDLTAGAVADRLQVSIRTVCYWKAGKRIPFAVVQLLQQMLREKPSC